jgi:hypothetical protein
MRPSTLLPRTRTTRRSVGVGAGAPGAGGGVGLPDEASVGSFGPTTWFCCTAPPAGAVGLLCRVRLSHAPPATPHVVLPDQAGCEEYGSFGVSGRITRPYSSPYCWVSQLVRE